MDSRQKPLLRREVSDDAAVRVASCHAGDQARVTEMPPWHRSQGIGRMACSTSIVNSGREMTAGAFEVHHELLLAATHCQRVAQVPVVINLAGSMPLSRKASPF